MDSQGHWGESARLAGRSSFWVSQGQENPAISKQQPAFWHAGVLTDQSLAPALGVIQVTLLLTFSEISLQLAYARQGPNQLH